MFESNKNRIVGHLKVFGIISAILCSIALIGIILTMFGVPVYKLSLDFTGGVLLDVELGTPVTKEVKTQVKNICAETTGNSALVTKSEISNTGIAIKIGEISNDVIQQLVTKIGEKYGADKVKLLDKDTISLSSSKALKNSALRALLIAGFIIMIYISIRFGIKSGLAAIICLIQNILVMLLFYAIFRMPLDVSFIATVLIIFAYSIIQTVLVFDVVRDKKKNEKGSIAFADIVEKSILKSLRQNISIMVASLLLVLGLFIMGSPSIRAFSFSMIIGICAGAYSAILMAGSLWNFFVSNRK